MPANSVSGFPLVLDDGTKIATHEEALDRVLGEAAMHVLEKEEKVGPSDLSDYKLSCDALVYNRLVLRLREEAGHEPWLQRTESWLRERICEEREYDSDEFELAILATKDRVRIPYGMDPIRMAYQRQSRNPIILIDEELKRNRLLAAIAGVAFNLDKVRHRPYILMPVGNLRELFECRKVAVTGAIATLLQRGFLEDFGTKYGQGRARRFRWVAKENEHYTH